MASGPDANLLLDHLESRLGEMQSGTRVDGVGRLGSISILRFTDVPVAGAVTYTTFGLSRAPLHVDTGRHVRLELMLSLQGEPEPFAAAPWLLTLAEHLGDEGVAPRRGEVHGMGRLADGSALEGFALVEPARFDDGFAFLDPPGDVPIALLELIPLSAVEAGFVRAHGWDAFVDVVERNGPNFLDLHRAELLRRTPCADGQHDHYHYFEADGGPVPG